VPELPEVETIVRALVPRLEGRRIRDVQFYSRQVLRHCLDQEPEFLVGRRIKAVERRGKFIVISLDRGYLVIHLGMTGQILFDSPRTPYTRAVIALDDATIMYEDTRMFGTIEWGETLTPRVDRLGPEPFAISPGDFHRELHRRRAPIKAVLLDQTVVRGVGNIYADEALFRAGIHPRTRAARIRPPRALRLHAEIATVLAEAIEHRGSSVSDYRDAEGRKGEFQMFHRVYGRDGQPCVVCGRTIRRIVVGGRGTHYCPHCQR
jgi:formamidopyrimidine-DNA glycosylase